MSESSRRIQAWEACKDGSFTCAADVILELRMQTTMFMPQPNYKNPNDCPLQHVWCNPQKSLIHSLHLVLMRWLYEQPWTDLRELSCHCLLACFLSLQLHEKTGKVSFCLLFYLRSIPSTPTSSFYSIHWLSACRMICVASFHKCHCGSIAEIKQDINIF